MFNRICRTCGTPFEAKYKQTKYCSKECAGLFQAERKLERRRRIEEEDIVQANSKSLYDIAKLAADAGMSYGKYVQTHKV